MRDTVLHSSAARFFVEKARSISLAGFRARYTAASQTFHKARPVDENLHLERQWHSGGVVLSRERISVINCNKFCFITVSECVKAVTVTIANLFFKDSYM